ncbi:DUF736 domain-containing protein [Maricaulis sp.]|uniref:DUF736 domain-containing protein n=1 Tax=Maricaulis sp. TaxID=1486257 RepID=UPI003A8D7645
MSKIGTLKPTGPGDFWSDLRGSIRTLAFKAIIRIAATNEPQPHTDAPTHRVYVQDPDGEQMDLGSAWSRTINRGPNTGGTFLSVTLDDPSFPHPINFAVFKDGEAANAVWRRRQDQAA